MDSREVHSIVSDVRKENGMLNACFLTNGAQKNRAVSIGTIWNANEMFSDDEASPTEEEGDHEAPDFSDDETQDKKLRKQIASPNKNLQLLERLLDLEHPSLSDNMLQYLAQDG